MVRFEVKYYSELNRWHSSQFGGNATVIVFDKAICTSGAKVDGKSFEASVLPLTFEAYRPYSDSDRMTSLNIRIYYPKTSADVQNVAASAAASK